MEDRDGQHRQQRPDDGGDHRPALDHGEREKGLQLVHRQVRIGQQAREHHEEARSQHKRACRHRDERPACGYDRHKPRDLGQASTSSAPDLGQRQKQQRDHEGQQKVNQPVEQQCRHRVVDRNRGREGCDHNAFEDTDAAGHMARNTNHRGHCIDGQHVGERQRSGGQQKVQHQRGHENICEGDEDLPHHVWPGRCGEGEMTDLQRSTPTGDYRRDQDHDHADCNRRPAQYLRRPGHQVRQSRRMDRQCGQPDQRGTDPIGDGRKGRNCRDIIGIQPQCRIDPVTHRTARDGAEPDRVAKCVAQEPAKRDGRRGRGLADVTQGRPVVTDQRDIPGGGSRQRRGDQMGWCCADLAQHDLHVERGEQMIQSVGSGNEKQPRDKQWGLAFQLHPKPCAAVLIRDVLRLRHGGFFHLCRH